MPKRWKQYPDEHYPRGEKVEGIPLRQYDLILNVKNTLEEAQEFSKHLKSSISILEVRYQKKIKSFIPLIASLKNFEWHIQTIRKIIRLQVSVVKKEAQELEKLKTKEI